ncbi:MAG: OB-fold domain-containing protein, partial [Candidatus Bathyarchaeota archaeon]|nr:OB-fold domain-containing protein [Candidatus Bathyarchaeota archaeon]
RGEIEAFTHVIVRPASFQHREPYTIAIARLVDGIKVLAWLREAEITDVDVGLKVRLTAGKTLEGDASYWFVPE